jgi:hypothetical protein
MGDLLFGCSGCFLWLVFFAIVYFLIVFFVGIFWVALVGTIGFLVLIGIGILVINKISGLFKNKNKCLKR